MEWKKKAIDYENAYKNAVKGFEGTRKKTGRI